MNLLYLIVAWIISGYYAYGITYGYFSTKYNDIDVQNGNIIIALVMSCGGILGLIVSYILSDRAYYGLKWRIE